MSHRPHKPPLRVFLANPVAVTLLAISSCHVIFVIDMPVGIPTSRYRPAVLWLGGCGWFVRSFIRHFYYVLQTSYRAPGLSACECLFPFPVGRSGMCFRSRSISGVGDTFLAWLSTPTANQQLFPFTSLIRVMTTHSHPPRSRRERNPTLSNVPISSAVERRSARRAELINFSTRR